MTVRLTCGDGVIVRLPHKYFERAIFNNPEIAMARSYTLRCEAKSDTLDAILDMADGEAETVTITEDNFEELKSLCNELGFRGLDKELCAFRGETGRDSVDLQEFLLLKERVTRQDKRFLELERQLNEVLSWKRKAESVSREFQSLERKVEEVARVCEERNVEASRKTERALRECAKQRDVEELARDLAQLNASHVTEKAKSESVSGQIQSLERKVEEVARVCEERNVEASRKTERALRECAKQRDLEELAGDLARLKQTAIQRQTREFVYDSSKRLDGVIAHLTRECGGNVHDKGIVNVMGTGKGHREAVEFGDDRCYWSENANSCICYDFVDRRVIPTSYSIRSHWTHNLKSWVIEVSNDGYSWTEIDRRDNNNDLNAKHVTANFKISRVPSESFRFFRLRQTGKNHGSREDGERFRFFCLRQDHEGKDGFCLTAMEIFGTLFVMEVEKMRPPKQEFVYHADREGQVPPPLFPPKLDGVIAHLTREWGGNVHDRGIVNVTASSFWGGSCQRAAADLGTDSWYESKNEKDTWICYDFKERRVIPTSYSVRSYGVRPGYYHLKSWVIEVSNDGSSWTEIDRRDNNSDLNDRYVTVNFKISEVPSESFRFFRLRQTGENHTGGGNPYSCYYVCISSLEIFGTLFEK